MEFAKEKSVKINFALYLQIFISPGSSSDYIASCDYSVTPEMRGRKSFRNDGGWEEFSFQ